MLHPRRSFRLTRKEWISFLLVSGNYQKIVCSGLHGGTDNPFDQGQPQNGNKGLAVALLLKPAPLAGGDDQALHAH